MIAGVPVVVVYGLLLHSYQGSSLGYYVSHFAMFRISDILGQSETRLLLLVGYKHCFLENQFLSYCMSFIVVINQPQLVPVHYDR